MRAKEKSRSLIKFRDDDSVAVGFKGDGFPSAANGIEQGGGNLIAVLQGRDLVPRQPVAFLTLPPNETMPLFAVTEVVRLWSRDDRAASS
jgi:hypothetical protein